MTENKIRKQTCTFTSGHGSMRRTKVRGRHQRRHGRGIVKWVQLEPHAAAWSEQPPTLLPLWETPDSCLEARVALQHRQVRCALRESVQLLRTRKVCLRNGKFLPRLAD
ncbi:hypothetical protein EUGRSUZ_E04088 [Eucalyptus grandis]|uniref:Uncharacterized protein n=2 Tax=Eucalyptus grandis TaxID=71139 RepID=A0ACC3L138_EUCGR|nr:hypothetical protein EUGRSUZ_E04088 [Eucalyptus grandis]